MKHSKLLSALTLIALASLLFSAHNECAMADQSNTIRKSSHKLTTETVDHADQRHPPQLVQPAFQSQISEALHAIVNQQESARREDQASEKLWPPSPSWAIVYVTIAYVIVAIFQWRALRKTVDETQGLVVNSQRQAKAAENQVNNLEKTLAATEKAATAAEKSTDFAVRSFYTLHRPWVLVTDFQIVQNDETKRFDIHYKAYNVGQLPAIWRGVDHRTDVQPNSPSDVDFSATRQMSYVLPPLSSPEQGITLSASLDMITDAQWKTIREGKNTLFFMGFVRYEGPYKDTNGNPILYQTGFGASHQGLLTYDGVTEVHGFSPNEPLGGTAYTLARFPTRMFVMLDPRYNYLQ